MKNGETKVNIAVLQEQYRDLKEDFGCLRKDVRNIKENDLVHIDAKIEDVKTEVGKIQSKIAYWSGGMAVIVVITQWVLSQIQ